MNRIQTAQHPLETKARYRGRFAPSPTGELHFGSLVAAVGSYLDAKAQGGEWIVRIEDVDTTRCTMESATSILKTLEKFGFRWDGPILYQSRRSARYQEILESLIQKGMAYGCACSRKDLASNPKSIDGAPLYLGRCRQGIPEGTQIRSHRLRVPDADISFTDRIQGTVTQNLEKDVGDFVIKRADGLFAYQLAVVVDDIDQGITDIVRGVDLLDSTPRQIWLYQCLNAEPPAYAHLPLAVNAQLEKLSKQTYAPSIANGDPIPLLNRVLHFLGLAPLPGDITLDAFWADAVAQWDIHKIPKKQKVIVQC